MNDDHKILAARARAAEEARKMARDDAAVGNYRPGDIFPVIRHAYVQAYLEARGVRPRAKKEAS
jgi:hypothetical protein